MNAHALIVLEAAEAEAQVEPIKASAAVRLALAWLVLNGVAERWQVISFYNALTKPPAWPDPHVRWNYDYCRRRDMEIFLERWRINARKRGSGEKVS
jgi:hypothetical protein